jgi:hypothetical protein
VGAACATIVFVALDGIRQRTRRMILATSADALHSALERLAEDGELGYHHMQEVSGLRDLASSLCRIVGQ